MFSTLSRIAIDEMLYIPGVLALEVGTYHVLASTNKYILNT